jgi:pilus assembly protein CpaD
MKYSNKCFSALIKATGCAVIAITASGCESLNGEVDDVYQPPMHYQRYPIEVAQGKVQMKVPARSSRLSAAHEDAVARFAQEAVDHQDGGINIARPAGQTSGDVIAGRVTQLLNTHGVSSGNIRHSTYKGRGPVIMSYKRHMARTAECGDWSEDLNTHTHNLPYPNFGCAQQHNLAAIVANPKDFVQPRTATSASSARRSTVLGKYADGEPTAASTESGQDIQISDAVK